MDSNEALKIANDLNFDGVVKGSKQEAILAGLLRGPVRLSDYDYSRRHSGGGWRAYESMWGRLDEALAPAGLAAVTLPPGPRGGQRTVIVSLADLVASDEWVARKYATETRSATAIRFLAASESVLLRVAVAGNRAVPADVLQALIEDPDEVVREDAANAFLRLLGAK
jgi:hypothetical protein